MPEEVLFESEQHQTREQIANSLTAVAEKLRAGEPITLRAGTDSYTTEPPAQLTFEVKAEREGPAGGSGELSIEFELEWPEDGGDGTETSGTLEIE
ncbi:MAG: amphi-Trp domain-containing protein [Halobacteriota archaeon]